MYNSILSQYVLNVILDEKGNAVVQLVEELCYKLEGHGFDSQSGHWNFSLTQSFQPHCGSEVNSPSNRNEYQKYLVGSKDSQCVEVETLPASCADCLQIWQPQPSGTLWACNRPAQGLFYLFT